MRITKSSTETAASAKTWLLDRRSSFASRRDDVDDLQTINRVMLWMVVPAVAAAVWVGWKAGAVGPVLLWVFASFAAGGTAGFLFGIPKSGVTPTIETKSSGLANGLPLKASDDAQTFAATESIKRARPNTNLEEISDWITKIVVGLTLVNLKDLQKGIEKISLNAAAGIRAQPDASDVSAATALVVGFALLGFLVIYLYMRLFVQGAIGRADNQMSRFTTALHNANQLVQLEPIPDSISDNVTAVVPSVASLKAAQAVADATPESNPELVLLPLRQLANDYESLRLNKEYSPERTRKMGEIVVQMRPYAIAAAPYISELVKSNSTGDHLAATVIMQMKYLPEYMEWLARRLVEERAFIGYQAASALLARVRLAGVAECKKIQDAVASAKADRASLNLVEASLDRLIEQILDSR